MKPQVALIMGSHSDYDKLEGAMAVFRHFGIPFEVRVMSAHRTPDVVAEYAKSAEGMGIKVIVAAAGGAAHLPGVIAAFTILPVIGIPIAIPSLGGLDSLLSIAQMPAGIPVAAMPAGGGGAQNGALMAVSILAVNNEELAEKLREYRRSLADKVLAKDAELQAEMAGGGDVCGRA